MQGNSAVYINILILIFIIIFMIIAHTVWYSRRTGHIRSAVVTVIQITGLIFVIELTIMLALSAITGHSSISAEALIDSIVLSCVAAPFIFFMVIKPLHHEIDDQVEQSSSVEKYAMNGIIVIDDKGIVKRFNQKAEELFGYHRGEVIGKSINILMPEPYKSEHDRYIKKYLETGEAKILGIGAREVEGIKKNGERFPIELSSSLITLKNKKKLFLGIISDITERRNAQETIKKNYDHLHEVYRLSNTINQTNDLRDIYEESMNSLERILHIDKASITLFNYAGIPEFKVGRGVSEYAWKFALEYAIKERNENLHNPASPLNIITTASLGHPGEILQTHGIDSVCSIPVIYQNQLLGQLVLYFTGEKRQVTQQELSPARTIANHIAFGINRTKMENQQKKLIRVLRAISDINQLIAKEREVTGLLDQVCHILLNTRDYKLAWIGIYHDESHEIVPVAKAGVGVELIPTTSKLEENEYNKKTSKVQTAIIRKIRHNKNKSQEFQTKLYEYGLKINCAIPLLYREQRLGILNIYSDNEEQFDAVELSLLNELAGNIAFGLNNIGEEEKRKLAEQGLEKSNEQFQNFFYLNPEPCCISKNGVFLYINQAYINLLGYQENELIGKSHQELNIWVNPEHQSEINAQLKKDGHVHNQELSLHTREGKLLTTLYSAQIIDFKGETSLLSIIHDITEQKKSEEDLRQAKQAAEMANIAKSDFLANMSHEIRTPMNAIIGMADLLAETNLDKEQQEYVTIFRKSGDHLLALINDILDLSKIEAGHIELEEISFEPEQLIDKIMEIMAVKAHSKNIELLCDIAPDIPPRLTGDPNRLNQVLINLVGNAVKFTEKGEIKISVSINKNHFYGGNIELLFVVSDTGIGIPADKLSVIFNNFTQVDSSTTRKYGGTGLGLTISRKLVSLMGGTIWAESPLQEGGQDSAGSRFCFTACFHAEQAGPGDGPAKQAYPLNLHRTKILIIDDNATNGMILQEFLKSWGADAITITDNPSEVVHDVLAAYGRNDPYQLVIIDMQMPGSDGIKMIRDLQKYGFMDENQFILMLPSFNLREEYDRAKSLGLTRYLFKPVKKQELKKAVYKALNHLAVTGVRNPVPPHVIPADMKYRKVLLVDDSEDNRQIIKLYMKNMPYTVDMADNGLLALEKAKAGSYDIILMDIQMPVMDGYEATRQIRRWEQENNISPVSIIALTAHAFDEDVKKSREAGCTDHLTKPVKKNILHQVLEKYS